MGFVCKHQKVMAWCKIHDCEECTFRGNEQSCPYAHNMSGDTMPSFRQAIEIYEKSGRAKRPHAKQVADLIRRDIAMFGLSEDDKLMEMTYTRFETLIERLQSPTRDGGPLRSHSIASHLSAFGSITSPKLDGEFRKKSLDPYRFSRPEFVAKAKKQTVTEAQARLIEIGMERWFASGNKSDLAAALFVFFGFHMGMRAGDICNLKWGSIRQTTRGVMLVYTPRKTDDGTGSEVSFVMDSTDFHIIQPYIGKPDEYVIPRHDNRIPGYYAKREHHGEFAGFHGYTRKKVNKLWASAGVGNEYRGQKKSHAGRKFRETMNALRFGEAEAARRSGHSERVARKYYIGSEYSLVPGCGTDTSVV